MNVAILIGIAEYSQANSLPACRADVTQMSNLLKATGKYEMVRCLTERTESSALKTELRAFFSEYQDVPRLEEVFVYFSGHGVYHDDALLCCSDYDPNRPATTSISNQELDDLLRSVSPEVTVKVVDACQSGSPYIKDAADSFEKALRSSRLKSFICMASSKFNQSSYATAEASDFTAKWIGAALLKQNGVVFYRDIQASLADAFVKTPEQTPYFVNQGTGLEQFAAVTQEMRRLASGLESRRIVGAPADDLGDLVAAEVARLDEDYVSADLAFESVQNAGIELDELEISDALVARFYRTTVERQGKLPLLPKVDAVAQFAQEQGWERDHFVRIHQKALPVRVPRDWLAVFRPAISRRADEDYVTEMRNFPANLEATQGLPFEVAEITFGAPDHPALKSFVLFIGLVHSRTQVVVLSATARLKEKGWQDRTPDISEIQWQYETHRWREVLSEPKLLWRDAMERAETMIKSYLHSLAKKPEGGGSEDTNLNGTDQTADV